MRPTVLLILSVLLTVVRGQEAQPFDYRPAVVVLFNQNDPQSKNLARHYAKQRGIPEENLLGLACSREETITREQFLSTIELPLRAAFEARKWWRAEARPGEGNVVVETRMRVIAVMRGIPLRISEQGAAPQAGRQNQASVDSELAVAGLFDRELAGPIRNPYFGKEIPFYQAPLAPMFLVGRIDGPDDRTARRLIDDAVLVENAGGLFGRAYVDLARKTGGGYEIGDQWLQAAAAACERKGIPVIMDTWPETFPKHYPMEDCGLYLGWYVQHADGPFLRPGFRLRRGAVACHIHSFSATTLRDTKKYWCGPLLDAGACGVLGNVWEPYLDLCVHLDKFTQALLSGRNLAEAAWGASKGVSWMGVVIGDPLYTPFPGGLPGGDRKFDADYKLLRVAMQRWPEEKDRKELIENLAKAAESMKSGTIYEFLGLHAQAGTSGSSKAADPWLTRAEKTFPDNPDKVRVLLEKADALRREGNTSAAAKVLQDITKRYPGELATDAARAWLEQLQAKP